MIVVFYYSLIKSTNNKMGNQQSARERISSFSDFFKEAKLDENNFIVPADGTWREKADMQMRRLKVAQMVLNGDKTTNKADTNQRKYTPWFWVKPDTDALAGFRLAYIGYGDERDNTDLGARPELVDWQDAVFLGEKFTEECQLLAQYQAMAEQELMSELRGE